MKSIDKYIVTLYPTTKLLAVLFIIVSALIVPGYTYQYAIFPLMIIIAFFTNVTKQFLNIFIKTIVVIVLFIFIFQVLLIPGEEIVWEWGFLSVSMEGFINSLLITSKLIAVSSTLILFFQITPAKDLIYSLERLGLSKKVSFVILSTLQLIPQMKELSNTIMDAQRSRGIETEGGIWVRIKAFFPMIGPLVLSSIQQTEERVLTLESRAFSSTEKKTHVYHVEKRAKDTFVRLFVLLLFIILIGERYIL